MPGWAFVRARHIFSRSTITALSAIYLKISPRQVQQRPNFPDCESIYLYTVNSENVNKVPDKCTYSSRSFPAVISVVQLFHSVFPEL